MRDSQVFTLGEYQATPIAEGWGDHDWLAGVLLSADDARGDRPAKSLYAQVFASQHEALEFARRECAVQASALTPG